MLGKYAWKFLCIKKTIMPPKYAVSEGQRILNIYPVEDIIVVIKQNVEDGHIKC